MYTEHFGLHELPFSIAPDPLYLFLSERHQDALAHLEYGVKAEGGFILLTGEVGTGKTTLCRRLLEKLPDQVDVAYIINPRLNPIELLETLCDELKIDKPSESTNKKLVDHLNAYLLKAFASGRKTVLIIDEAQNLSVEVLEQIRLLTNLETNRCKLVQVMLLGQPELLEILGRRDLRQLAQRVTARFHLGPLGEKEIDAYVHHRLKIAGCERPLFAPNLNRMIWRYSNGLPRLINLICDRALMGAYAQGIAHVDRPTLVRAAEEVLGTGQAKMTHPKNLLWGSLWILTLFCIVFGFWSWNSSRKVLPDHDNSPLSAVVQQTSTKPLEQEQTHMSSTATEQSTLPEDFFSIRNEEKALKDLAQLWEISLDEESQDVCQSLRNFGLDCLTGIGTLDTLEKINRPAALTLYDDDGSPFYAILSELDDDRALLIVAEGFYSLSLDVITMRWFGDYLLLWQPPSISPSLLRPGDSGPAVAWLAQVLGSLELYKPTGVEGSLEGPLLGAFKKFQFKSGLIPDGILGPMSMVHLNTARKVSGPRLTPKGKKGVTSS